MAKRFGTSGSSDGTMTPDDAYEQLRRYLTDSEHSATRSFDLSRELRAVEVLWSAFGRTRSVIELTADIVSSRHEAQAGEKDFRAFERILRHDYRDFARRENFPGEADALEKLNSVFERMNQIRLARDLALRNICTVAGRFSSGKSSLLNRLIGADILPTKITPTTAVPTYVWHSEEDQVTISAFNRSGGRIEVPPRTLEEMTHGFGETDGMGEGIPLRAIVDRVCIKTPALEEWSSVAFVDTPGYTNSGDDGHIDRDEQVALREVLASRFLIWVMDCENGALTDQDIRFVQKFVMGGADAGGNGGNCSEPRSGAPIYFVLNKAEKKITAEREEILKSVALRLKENEIPCSGVGLYSATEGEWYGNYANTFEEFLNMMQDEAVKIALVGEVDSVFEEYAKYHDGEEKRLGDMRRLLTQLDRNENDMKRDTTEGRVDRELDRHVKKLEEESEYHRQHSWEARSLGRRFVKCTRAFMSSMRLETETNVGGGGA